MFGSIVLDVATGMVLIYLLYSLLATVLGELISSWLGLRSRGLRKAIGRMLNDQEVTRHGGSLLSRLSNASTRLLSGRVAGFEQTFAGKFCNYPAIKYMAERNRKWFSPPMPSYLTKETFAQTLVHLFRGKGAGSTDVERIDFCLKFNTLRIEPETLSYLRNVLADAKGSLDAFTLSLQNWFEETMDRATGWYKRKNRVILFLIGVLIAVSFNVDSMRIARLLSRDKDARSELVSLGVAVVSDSSKLKPYINSGGDTITSTAILDSGLVNVSEDLRKSNMILGEGWDFSSLTKYCTMQIPKTDSSHVAWVRVFVDSITYYNVLILKMERDIAFRWYQDSIAKSKRASLSVLRARRSWYIEELNDSLASQFVEVDSCSVSQAAGVMNVAISGKVPSGLLSEISFVLSGCVSHVWGFLITALMISLGAPFWFNLLQKLLALRSAGVKPEEKEAASQNKNIVQPTSPKVPDSGSPVAVATQPSPTPFDFVDKAIQLYASSMKDIPGVKLVFKGFIGTGKNERKCLQVNVSNIESKRAIETKFRKITIDGISVPLRVVVSGHPRSHQSHIGQISNGSGRNGFGSLGLVLQDRFDGTQHILSCWHVLKGDLNYDFDDDFKTILDYSGAEVATRWAGGIQGNLDYGLAQIMSPGMVDNDFITKALKLGKIGTRPIVADDINKHLSVKYYDSLNTAPKNGRVYSASESVPIGYADRDRDVLDVLLITDSNSAEEKPISAEGDSGSVIFDEGGNGIAMIIGADDKYTYATKLSNFFAIHGEMSAI